MPNFKKTKCVVCKENFIDSADVVVCPKCGAPYHKNCYNIENKCIYESVHGTDASYHVDYKNETDYDPNIGKLKICPKCSTENPSDANFCNKCGYVFLPNGENIFNNEVKIEIPPLFDPLGGVDPNKKFDGVEANKVAKFVVSNTPYYMNVFSKIDDTNRSKFNFSAFLFTGAWFLYRKLYKIGIILSIVVFGLTIASLFVDYFFSMPLLRTICSSLGLSVSSEASFQMNDYMKVYSELLKFPVEKQVIFYLPSVLKFINFLIMIFSGFLANKIYYKHCIKELKNLDSKILPINDYNLELQKRGGVNIRLMWLMFFLHMVVNILPSFLSLN